ncbi:Serine/threonine-protein kinase Nek3 [Phlyctochytrium bullatum]|nr:Serine/threonine-protein kinase Nek3 [Phlyctochytrium bullatum]
MVKDLPSTTTKAKIGEQLHIEINGPLANGPPNILTAQDQKDGRKYVIKLLRLPEMNTSTPIDQRKDAIEKEVRAATMVYEAQIDGLVRAEAVEVTVEDSSGLGVSRGKHMALRMRHYLCSLDLNGQMSEENIRRGFERMMKALNGLHQLGLVHMDVKSGNIFMDESGVWDLGDFGSARTPDEIVFSWTEMLTPYKIPRECKPIPSMDYVQLCVVVAVELNKLEWKNRLCGKEYTVQPDLIKKCLSEIKDGEFRKIMSDLFEEHYSTVIKHIQNTGANEEEIHLIG